MISNYEEKELIDTYQFLIDTHIEMIGSGKNLEKLESKIQNIIAKADETKGTIEKKNFSEKYEVLKFLFKSTNSVRNILVDIRNELMLSDKKKAILNEKEITQSKISVRAVNRFDTMDKNYNKYTNDTNEIETSASKFILGKPKFYSIHKQVSEFEFSELKEDLEIVIGDGENVDTQRVSSIVKSTQRKLKNAEKQKINLEKKMMKQNKLVTKIQDALKIATERRKVLYKFFSESKVQYKILKKISLQVVDDINSFLNNPSKFRIIPEITMQKLNNENDELSDEEQSDEEQSGGIYDLMYSDNNMYGGKEIKTRMHKYNSKIESSRKKLAKYIDNIDKTENKDKVLIDSINIYHKMFYKLKGASKEFKSYIKAAQKLDKLLKEGSLHLIQIIKKWKTDQEDVNNRDLAELEEESLRELEEEEKSVVDSESDEETNEETNESSDQSAGWFY